VARRPLIRERLAGVDDSTLDALPDIHGPGLPRPRPENTLVRCPCSAFAIGGAAL
jgi:hypothetical protein